ncbi:ABC transporter permease subunit [Clostridium botulinum]|nr:ABC transporter permease subunit [Clostridium botulinum]MCS4478336.1 ABC transporter permease subunit [Clostridium botulinum]
MAGDCYNGNLRFNIYVLTIINRYNRGIDKNFIDASLDLGGGFNYTLIRIVLPIIKPGIIVSALLAFVRSLSDFGTPMIIGGSFQVLATEVYMNIIANGNFGMAAAMSVLILIPSLIAF